MPSKGERASKRFRNDETLLYGNDAPDARRMEVEHDLIKLVFRRERLAPVSQPQHILQIFCGIGLWGLEVLGTFPGAQLTALDTNEMLLKHFLQMSRAQRYYSLLDRIKFVRANPTKSLPFASGTFDFTYVQLLSIFLPTESWSDLIREMTRVTQPDGWVEILAAGRFYTEQPSEICTALADAQARLYQAIHVAPTEEPDLRRYLEEAGITTFQWKQGLVGKSATTRLLLTKDLRHIMWKTKDLIRKHDILPGEQFEAYLAQFEQEAKQAGILMPCFRIWFQPNSVKAL